MEIWLSPRERKLVARVLGEALFREEVDFVGAEAVQDRADLLDELNQIRALLAKLQPASSASRWTEEAEMPELVRREM